MSGVRGGRTIKLDIKWLESGSFFLTAGGSNQLSHEELGRLLFTWDARSFYGTMCRHGAWQGRPAIVLGAFEALDFFTHDYANTAVQVEWPPGLVVLKHAAAKIAAALREGRFQPDFHAWQEGSLRWKLAPETATGEDSLPLVGFFDDWVHQAIAQKMVADVGLQAAWQAILQEAPQLAATSAFNRDQLDEQEWLIAIGLRRDATPFTVGIGLVEPDDELSWRLQVVLQDQLDEARLFVYEADTVAGLPVAWREWLEVVTKTVGRWIHLVPWLEQQGTAGTLICDLDEAQALTFLAETAPALTVAGFRVYLPDWWETARRANARLKAKVKSSVGATNRSLFGIQQIVQFDWAVAIGDMQLTPEEFAVLLEERRKLVQVRGRWVVLDAAFYDQALKKMKRIEKAGGLTLRDVLEMHLTGDMTGGGRSGVDGEANGGEGGGVAQASASSNLLGDDVEKDVTRSLVMEVELNRELAALMAQLKDLSKLELLPEPVAFQGKLRPYQRVGYSWLSFLRQFGLGACLADDMGLGKTIQYIAYLLAGKESRGTSGFGVARASRAEVAANAASRAADGLVVDEVVDAGGATSADEVAAAGTAVDAEVATNADGRVALGVDAGLLICPTSLIGNWERELRRFAPELRVYVHYGSSRRHEEAFERTVAEADLVLTTYGLANLDESDLTRVEWDSVCLDEAQNIKNAYTKQTESIRKLRGRHFIAMTGTPVENRLTELWSIFDFLNPGYLGSLRTFRERFVNPIERTRDAELIGVVQRLVQPFLLRREKRDPAVELDLPEKDESKLYVPLTAEQAALYEATLQKMLKDLDSLSMMERRGAILGTLTKLKQICDHPAVFLKERAGRLADAGGVGSEGRHELDFEGVQQRSEKLSRLVEMVGELRAEGDKCLIFTQFVETGRLLQDVLAHELGEEVLFLHGGVAKAKRDEMVSRFQQTEERAGNGASGISSGGVGGGETVIANEATAAGPGSAAGPAVFILSLKAGGVGLNLTAATHVFHFDRWWNPAVENQATDRAYRIGQHRHVQVFKFVALGTLEERIDEMLESKLSLSEQVVGGGENWITELSTDDLRNLFMLRREWVEE